MDDQVARLYRSMSGLPRCTVASPRSALPSDGVYFFFEKGEQIEVAGTIVDRIVRVGTHRVDGRFPERIRQHYGNRGSLGGNKNGSVFRKHVGGALLRRDDPGDIRLAEWIAQGGRSYVEVEEEVSKELRDNFTFAWVQVPTNEARLSLESGLIALLARRPGGKPSSEWLGRHACDAAIAASGLWNTQHLTSPVLTEEQLVELERLASVSTVERR